jgi:hypothetical protein
MVVDSSLMWIMLHEQGSVQSRKFPLCSIVVRTAAKGEYASLCILSTLNHTSGFHMPIYSMLLELENAKKCAMG